MYTYNFPYQIEDYTHEEYNKLKDEFGKHLTENAEKGKTTLNKVKKFKLTPNGSNLDIDIEADSNEDFDKLYKAIHGGLASRIGKGRVKRKQ